MKLSKKYGGLQFFAPVGEPSLNGETWVLNESIDLTPGQYISTDIGFISNNEGFNNILIKGNSGTISYDSTVVWSYGWHNLAEEDTSAYRTVTFLTAPTGDLLTWLQANGVKQSSTPKVVETSLRFGADALAKSYLGADALDRIYLGTDLLYQTLNEYTVTETLSNVTTIGTHPVKILEGKSLTLKYTADANYQLPDSVTVAGATSNWTKSTGTLIVSNPTGDVTITITAVRITYSITENLTNVTKTGTHPTVIAAGQTLVLNYAAATGYNLPDTVTVTGATSDWKPATGALTITNPTSAVTITIAGAQPKLAAPTNLLLGDDTLTFDAVENAEQYEVFAESTSLGTYEPVYTLEAGTYKWVDSPAMPNSSFDLSSINAKYYYLTANNTYSSTADPSNYFVIDANSISIGDVDEGVYTNYYIGDGWYTRDQGADESYTATDTNKLRTIIVNADFEVSADLYNWAITGGNLVKQS